MTCELHNQRKRIEKLENDIAYCKAMIKIWEKECHNGCKLETEENNGTTK